VTSALQQGNLLGSSARGARRFWQVLPLNPPATHAGFSPYDSLSAFAGNPLLISPEDLATDGWIDTADLPAPLPSGPRADFKAALSIREHLFDLAFAHFTSSGHNEEFTAFCRWECDWLQDYALFRVISTSERELPWTEWPAGLRDRDPAALESFLRMHHAEVLREEFPPVQRISPTLPRPAEIVWWDTCHHLGHSPSIEAEEGAVSPYIRTVVADKDRQVTHEGNAILPAVLVKTAPLL